MTNSRKEALMPAGETHLLHSPLHDTHISLGATLTDFAGWAMPLRYSSELAEHHAVRATAGLFDLSHMGEIHVEGPTSGAALDYALVGDMSTMAPGRARYTMLCAADGGVLDDLVVYRLDEQHFMVVANAANRTMVAEQLVQRCAGAVVTDRSLETALVAVQGPAAAGIVEQAIQSPVDDLKYYASRPDFVDELPILLARTGYTGEDGFELFVDAAHAPTLWRRLVDVGGARGLMACGLACRDTLRLEAGMPLYGHELGTADSPFAAGLGRVVKFDKSVDFVGRTALADHREKPSARTLVGLRGYGRRAPRPGYSVLLDETVVGNITSGALSPSLGYPIAMAYVEPDARDAKNLTVDLRGQPTPVAVVALPFYQRTS